jgi:large subunit ribosomal protein L22
MQVTAHLHHLRMSPRKVRLIADLIRGVDVAVADAQLAFAQKAAALPLRKLLASAVANAEHNAKLNRANLFVERIFVDQGPTLKRFRARAFGRAATIRKRSAHVTVVLGERVPTTAAPKGARTVLPPPVLVTDRPRTGPAGHAGHDHEDTKDAESHAPGPATASEDGKEPFDVRRKGKHRNTADHGGEGRSGKHNGGFFRRLITRRFGEK